jgi:hypothetical protein
MLMVRATLQALGLAALIVTCLHVLGAGRTVLAVAPPVFSNYYADTPGVPAQLYVSPLPTPPVVGHTWITYQPLAPHEQLYHHHRRYYTMHYGAGYNVTTVRHCHSWFFP